MVRSKRPGRSSAGSRSAARLVAAMMSTFACCSLGRIIDRWLGSSRLVRSTKKLVNFCVPVGSSKLCICTSSSLTMPAPPSRLPFTPMPLRAAPMASNSSMNPMAPPSERAALRNALKKARTLRFVWP